MIITIKSYMNSADSLRGSLELADDARAEDALKALDLMEHTDIKGETILLLVNGQSADLQTPLQHGDELLILQSMAGG